MSSLQTIGKKSPSAFNNQCVVGLSMSQSGLPKHELRTKNHWHESLHPFSTSATVSSLDVIQRTLKVKIPWKNALVWVSDFIDSMHLLCFEHKSKISYEKEPDEKGAATLQLMTEQMISSSF